MTIILVDAEEEIHVSRLLANGTKIFTDKIDGHIIWETDPSMCNLDCDCWLHKEDSDKEIPSQRKKKRKGSKSSYSHQKDILFG